MDVAEDDDDDDNDDDDASISEVRHRNGQAPSF